MLNFYTEINVFVQTWLLNLVDTISIQALRKTEFRDEKLTKLPMNVMQKQSIFMLQKVRLQHSSD